MAGQQCMHEASVASHTYTFCSLLSGPGFGNNRILSKKAPFVRGFSVVEFLCQDALLS